MNVVPGDGDVFPVPPAPLSDEPHRICLFLPPRRKGPEGEESAKAPCTHALLMQGEGTSAACGEYHVHPSG